MRGYQELFRDVFDRNAGPMRIDMRLAHPKEGQERQHWTAEGEIVSAFTIPSPKEGEDGTEHAAVLQMTAGSTQRLHLLARAMMRMILANGLLADALHHVLVVDKPTAMIHVERALRTHLLGELINPPQGGTHDGDSGGHEPGNARSEGATGRPDGSDEGDPGPRGPAPDEGAEEGPRSDGDSGA